MRELYSFMCLFIIFLVLENADSSSFQCSSYCKESWNKFGYKKEFTYLYKYEGEIKTTISESHVHTKVFIKSDVQISVISSCDYVMQLSNIQYKKIHTNKTEKLLYQSNNQKIEDDLSQDHLYFSFQNGKIETVCPTNEANNILQIKKGILSAFQNSMSNFKNDGVAYETDVSGICETQYTVEELNGNLIIKKHKNLETCTHRKSQHTSWSTTPYSKSSPKSEYLLRSKQNCTQVISPDLILKSTECFETHLFKPFSNGDNGAITNLTQKLELVATINSIPKIKLANNYRYESLLSNYNVNNAKHANYDLETVTAILSDLEKNTIEGIESNVPKLFSRLIKELKFLNENEIIGLFEGISESSRRKNFLLDAIPLVTTPESIRAMGILYENKIITESHVNAWISSLLLTTEVSLPILKAITSFMKLNNSIKQKAILSGSTLLYMYCKTDIDCFEKMEVQEITQIIQEPLHKACLPNSFKNHQEILLALKAIGNIGCPTSIKTLRKCFMNNDSPLEIRLAAITAHRRINCAENDNLEQLLNYFGKINQNVEIRIASYLAVMQCSSYSTIAQVKDVLRHEETNQVGSFVWTHLTNLQESSSRWKQSIKSLVENEFLRNKFSTDVRKYSRNYEMSTFFDSLNAGATVESNVIFTSESYLPKSLMLNFTLDLFGEAVNILEVGVRMEGFEQVIENLFGPEGYFPEESIKNILESIKDKENQTHSYMKQFQNTFASRTAPREPSALLYTKIFGNENFYIHFKDIEGFVNETVTERNILEQLIKLLSQQSVDYTKSLVFMDSNFKIPTLLGFPLELSVNGTTVFGLTLNEKINLKDFSIHKFSVEGKMYPSVAIEIVGSMTVDCFDNKFGLTSVNTLNSNTYIDGHIFIDKGKLIDVKLNVPKQEMNIIKVKSQVYFINGDDASPMNMLTDNVEKWEGCTGKTFSNVTGLEVCYNMKYVNASAVQNAPFFPLTGAFEYSMGIKKTDVFENYQFTLQTLADISNFRPKYKISLNFDTPNSRVDRKIKTYYWLDCEKLSFDASLVSPFLNYDIHTKIGDDYDNLAFLLQTKLNKEQMILAQVNLKSSKSENTWTYEPLAMFSYKNTNMATLSGKVNYTENVKYSADLILESIFNDPIKIIGNLELKSKAMDLVGRIESNNLNGDVFALITKDQEVVSVVANTTYNFKNQRSEVIGVDFKQFSLRKPTLNTDGLYINVNSTQKSLYNILFSVETHRSKFYFENKILVKIFEDFWETHQLFKFFRSNGNTDIALRCTVKGMKKNIDYIFNFLYLNLNREFKFHILTQRNRIQRLETLINYVIIPEEKRIFDLLLYYPQHTLAFNGLFNQINEQIYNFIVEGHYEYKEDKMPLVIFKGEYLNSTLYQFENHTITGTIQIYESKTSLCTPWIFSSSVQISPDLYLSISQLKINNRFYLLHTTWSSKSLSALLQNNENQIFALSYAKNANEFSLLVGLNIYQHFEVNLKLTTPYKNFDFLLYWDKSRDPNQKVSLTINSQVSKGLYMIKIEYPNQLITASFIILPVQVTMNVTWGIDSSKRIYLKAGNKVYDIGGLWFAKLETPFKYLESQEFKLSYYVIPYNAELKLDMNWSGTKVNLVLSGMKTGKNLSGYLDVNTTIPEISKITIALSHLSNNVGGYSTIKNDGTFILNNHQILGQSFWESDGANISSNFEIISPSNVISPITGLLILNNNHTTKFLKSYINWNNKIVSIDYKFENSESYVKVKTPIEGFEVTEAVYTLIADDKNIKLHVKLNILSQLNYALLSWDSKDRVNAILFEVICPMIGVYKMELQHSTVFGHFDELFVITQGIDNEILHVILQGDLTPFLFLNVNASVKFLEHKASAFIKNSENPLSSTVRFAWNNNYITNTFILVQRTNTTENLNWNLNSSFLEENVTFTYTLKENLYLMSGNLHKNLKFNSSVEFENYYKLMDVVFNFNSEPETIVLRYHHDLQENYFGNQLLLHFNKNVTEFVFNYNINNTNNLMDKASLRVLSPWNHELAIQFSMPCENISTVYPNILIKYMNSTVLNIKSKLQFEYLNNDLQFLVHSKYIVPTVINFKSNLSNNKKSYNLVVKENGEKNENSLNLPLEKEYSTFVETSLNYNFVDFLKGLTLNINFPKLYQKVQFEANLNTISQSGNFALDSTILNFEKVFANYSVKLTENMNYINLAKNDKSLSLNLLKKNLIRNKSALYGAKLVVASNFDFIKNSSIEYIYKSEKKSRDVKIVGLYDQYYGLLQGNCKFINNGENNDFFSLEGKIANQLTHRNFTLVNLNADLKGILKFENSSGEMKIIINSNLENFEKLHSKLNYQISKKSNLVRNLFLEPFSNTFDFLVDFQASTLYDRVNGKIDLAKNENTVNTKMLLVKNIAVYNVSMLTTYDSLLCTTTTIKFATPNKTYTGKIVSNFTLLNTKLILHGKFDDNNLNTFELEIKSPTYNKMELFFLVNFVNLDFIPWKINAKYDITSKNKFIFFEGITQNGPIVEVAVDMTNVNLEINYPHRINLIKICGTHNLNNLNNISIIYNFSINKKFDNFNYPTKILYLFKIKNFNSTFGLDTTSNLNDTVLNLNYHQHNTFPSYKFLKNPLNDINFLFELQNPVLKKFNFYLHSSQEANTVRVIQNSKSVLDFNLSKNNKEMFLKVDNSWKPFLLEYSFENFLNINGKLCWNLNQKNVSQLGGHINIKENVSIEVILPTRILSLESNYLRNNFSSYYFGQFSWQKNKKVVILLSKLNTTVNNDILLKYEGKIDTPIRLIQAFYETQENFQVSKSKKWKAAFKWNRDDNSKIYFQNCFIHGNLESKLFLPILKRDLIFKINVNNQTFNFSNLKAELEYSEDAEKRVTFEMYYDKELSDIFRSERKFILKHPASRIDYYLNLKTLGSPEFTTGNITFRYKNYVLNRPEEIRSSLTIGHKKFLISGNIQTNKNLVQFSSYTKSGKHFQKVFFLTQLNQKEPLTLESNYIFKTSGSSLSFSTNCGHSRNYQFYVGYPSKREITAHIIHNIFGREGVDGKFTLKLNSTQIIWLKINWKNYWIAQFKDAILEDYYDLRYVIREIGQQLIDVVDDNICQTIAKNLSELHNNVTDQIVRELNLLDRDYKYFTNYIRMGCQGNSFYCQDVINATKIILPNQGLENFSVVQEFFDFIGLIHERLEDIKDNIFSSLKKFYENLYVKVENSIKDLQNVGKLKQRGKQILKNGIDEARQSLKDMDELIDKVEDSVNRYIENIKNECQEFLEPYLKLLDDFVIYVEQRLAILQMLVLDILDNVQHYILNLRESRELLKFYITYINWLEEFHISDALEPIADIIESVLDVIIKDTKRVIDDFHPYIVSISEALFGNYEEINKLFEVEQCREILNKIYSKTLWIWNYNNLSETIKNSLHKIIAGFDDYLTSLLTLDYDRNNFENILDQSEYVIRSDVGLIEITQPIPFEWEALDELPRFNQVPLYDKLKHRFENLIKLERHHFTDLINTIKKYIGESSDTLLSPATNNIGMIVGKSHYITFDKKYYNFAGGCSYLLAGDLQTKAFSVVLNYKSATNKSLSVITDEHNLEISSDYISLNNNNIDFPLVTESLIVTRENLKIVVNHSKGLKVICNLEYDFCMIELSGWLFGKTGGLLGTLDNEKFTDMRLPDGDHTTDILKFVNSWHVDNCTDFNHVNDSIRRNISPLTVTLYETLCAVFFSNINSPSANCFNMVDPKPFHEMCVNNMKQTVNSTMCSTVAAYKSQCDRSNVYFPMPELCVFCKYGIGLNEIIFDRNNPTSVDVIFIKGSEYFGSSYELFSLPNNINKNLEKRGFVNNRFAVVGYDDIIGKPYVQTSQGQIWNYANQTINLELNSQPKETISAIEAIKFAVNMEFIPGVSKLFILLQCDLSSDDENLNSLHSMFGEKDIILHILCINGFNSQSEKLLEMDNKGHVFNIQNGLNIQDSYINSINATINVGISDQITDIYTLLALSTNGTVLSLNTKLGNEMDKILSSWSQIISKTSYRSPCQKCKCVTNSDGIGVIECKRCMSPIVKQLLNEYESNIMEFYSNQDSDEYV